MMESVRRINPAEDWIYQEQCGCRVVMIGEYHHHAMRLEVCHEHNGPMQWQLRGALVNRACAVYRNAELEQPPL